MATVWLTYAWEDNKAQDVDFAAQELQRLGVHVKLDRWNLQAGRRLWEQIENFIQNPNECDAWILYATQASLGSEPCREEFAYALDRALKTRGGNFPVIGLFPASIDNSLIPAGIKTRLYVSLADQDWKERVKAAAEGRASNVQRSNIDPFDLTMHELPAGSEHRFVIEVRPRAGTWCPFFAAVSIAEQPHVSMHLLHGPRGRVPTGGVLFTAGSTMTDDGQWHVAFAGNEATPTMSYYVFCKVKPSKLGFGVHNGDPQWLVSVR
jgi:hypothetical protein